MLLHIDVLQVWSHWLRVLYSEGSRESNIPSGRLLATMPDEPKMSTALFETFQRYKRATGKVIRWLAINSNNTDVDHDGQSWSLEYLKQAAGIVKRKAIEVLEIVVMLFKMRLDLVLEPLSTSN